MIKYEKDLNRIRKNPLAIEEISWQRTPVHQLPPELFACKNLKYLSITRCGLQTIDERIGELESLEKLVLESNKITKIPASLLSLKRLETIDFSSNQVTAFPTFLMKHLSLESVSLNLNPIAKIPDFKGKNTVLKTLRVSNDKLSYVTPDLQQLVNLELLSLAYGQLTDLPIEFSNLTKLKFLEFHWNPVEKLPACLENLVKLTQINISKTKIAEFPDWVRKLNKLTYIKIGDSVDEISFDNFPPQFIPFVKTATIIGVRFLYPHLSFNDEKRLWQQLKTYEGTEKDILRYLHLFTGDKRISNYSNSEIIEEMMQSKEILIAQHGILKLTHHSLEKYPLKSGDEIALLGKLDLPDLRTLKKRIKEAGLKLVKKPTEKTTHWFVSRKIISDFSEEFAHLPMINSEQLLQFLNQKAPQFLEEDQENLPQNVENIRRLLFSNDESSLLLAFELIKSGGLPKKLMTDVFYFYQTTDNGKMRTKARNLVKKHASPQLVKNMRSRDSVKTVYNSQFKFNNFWKQVVEGTELDELKILYYMVRDYGPQHYAIYPLMNHPNAKPSEIIKFAVSDKKLRLRGMEQAKLIAHFSEIPHLEELELEDMKLEAFPSEIFQLTSLKSLTLKINIPEIPPAIKDLKHLTKLKLSNVEQIPLLNTNLKDLDMIFRPTQSFENALTNINNLKRLTIRFDKTITALPSFISSFTELEYLSIYGQNIKRLPEDLVALEQLKELNLNYVKLEKFPEILTKMPTLQTIYHGTYNYLIFQEHKHLFNPQIKIL